MQKLKYFPLFLLLCAFFLSGCQEHQAQKNPPSKEQVLQQTIQELQKQGTYKLKYQQTTESQLTNQKKATTNNQYTFGYKNEQSFSLSILEHLQSPTYKKEMKFQKNYRVDGESVYEDNKPKKSRELITYITNNYLEKQPIRVPSLLLAQLPQWKSQITMKPQGKEFQLHYETNQPETIQKFLILPAGRTVGKELKVDITVSPTFQINSVKSTAKYMSIEAAQKLEVMRNDTWKLN
ncbi:hypothetical protein SAMN05444392_101483 [Seinonella peptonophila]|uniref:Uncharacterized protein n=1 Tax=Seinonella peptonophila TaxID=112248 RepID=A0A1M4TJ07_9BACL|nr:hypothetical protein [Seinonella peptonophila]SHE44267.1 hypothetical protein SAMN05444392_101483 [Seinonella peptonophila]